MIATVEIFWLDVFVFFGLLMLLFVCFLFVCAVIAAVEATWFAMKYHWLRHQGLTHQEIRDRLSL